MIHPQDPECQPRASMELLHLVRLRFRGAALVGHQAHQSCTLRAGSRIRTLPGPEYAWRELALPPPSDLPSSRPDPTLASRILRKLSLLPTSTQAGWSLGVSQEYRLQLIWSGEGQAPLPLQRHWNRFSLHLPPPLDRRTLTQGCPPTTLPLEGLLARATRELEEAPQALPLKNTRHLPVILAPGDGGIFLHETLGHALEADLFPQSPLGRRPLSPLLSLRAWDERDPFWKGWDHDDAATPPSPEALVREGRLLATIGQNLRSRQLRGLAGFARRAALNRPFLPRMFGLYLAPGNSRRQEMLDLPLAVEALAFGEGRVSLSRNHFIFEVLQGRWLLGGKPGPPTGPFLMEGFISDALEGVDALGDDFAYDRGTCFCTRRGQTLPIRLGQPSLRLRRATLHPWPA